MGMSAGTLCPLLVWVEHGHTRQLWGLSPMLLEHRVPGYEPCDVRHALSPQISQVCQLCQQSPRLFSNHAAQLHTLLVSVQGPPASGPRPLSNPMTTTPGRIQNVPGGLHSDKDLSHQV